MDLKEDIRLVQNVRRNAYVKTKEFTVGALVKTKSGRKYTGCNIELSPSESICAEQVALTKAISEGEKEFEYMIIIGGKIDNEPERYIICEKCKKMMRNFIDENFKIYIIYKNRIDEYMFSQI